MLTTSLSVPMDMDMDMEYEEKSGESLQECLRKAARILRAAALG
jgi:hypothetical protein